MPATKRQVKGIRPPDCVPTVEGTYVRRPAGYSEAIAKDICRRLMLMETLTDICKDPRMPSMPTMVRWLADPRMAEFHEMYYRAKRVQAELLVEEIITIADDTSEDYRQVIDADGTARLEPCTEHIQRSRVRIDTRKWLAAKMLPRIYGEKKQVDHEVVGDLADLLKDASNKDDGLPRLKTIG